MDDKEIIMRTTTLAMEALKNDNPGQFLALMMAVGDPAWELSAESVKCFTEYGLSPHIVREMFNDAGYITAPPM